MCIYFQEEGVALLKAFPDWQDFVHFETSGFRGRILQLGPEVGVFLTNIGALPSIYFWKHMFIRQFYINEGRVVLMIKFIVIVLWSYVKLNCLRLMVCFKSINVIQWVGGLLFLDWTLCNYNVFYWSLRF